MTPAEILPPNPGSPAVLVTDTGQPWTASGTLTMSRPHGGHTAFQAAVLSAVQRSPTALGGVNTRQPGSPVQRGSLTHQCHSRHGPEPIVRRPMRDGSTGSELLVTWSARGRVCPPWRTAQVRSSPRRRRPTNRTAVTTDTIGVAPQSFQRTVMSRPGSMAVRVRSMAMRRSCRSPVGQGNDRSVDGR